MMANNPNLRRLALITIALVVAIALVLIIWLIPRPFLIWNASKSVPIGWYLVEHHRPKLNEIAVVKLEDWPELYASSRGYLPENVWLLKPVAAQFPAVICRFGGHVFVNGKLVARARILDSRKRILPRWKGCHALNFDEVFLIARPRSSFDSRYFGPVKLGQVIGVARRFRFPFK